MTWAIYALYEQVLGRGACPGTFSEVITSTIPEKQGCPLSPTIFGLYINKVINFIIHGDSMGINTLGTLIRVLFYADSNLRLWNSSRCKTSSQCHWCLLPRKGPTVRKFKAMIFHRNDFMTSHPHPTRRKCWRSGFLCISRSHVYKQKWALLYDPSCQGAFEDMKP